jgi:hypothetical protein
VVKVKVLRLAYRLAYRLEILITIDTVHECFKLRGVATLIETAES